MSDYSNFKLQIAEWANRTDWSDALVSSFVLMAESKFNQELRVGQMIQFDDGIITRDRDVKDSAAVFFTPNVH